MRIIKFLILSGLLAFPFFLLNAQEIHLPAKRAISQDARQFQIARTFQQLNQHQKAIPILEALYQKHPGNIQYYQYLLDSYLATLQYEKALQLIETQKQKDKFNPRYEIDYGNVLFQSGHKSKALQVWKKLLTRFPDNSAIYTMVANNLIRNNMFEEGIGIYLLAYRKFPKRSYILQNIANLYRSRLQFYKATRFYLMYLQKQPQQFNMVARQILSFHLEPSQMDSVLSLLNEFAQRNQNLPEVQLVIAKFYQKYRKYQRAFQIYKQLENQKSNGKYLYDFGKMALNDSLYFYAIQAFQYLIDHFPKSPKLVPAYLGLAQAYFNEAKKSADEEYIQKAQSVINEVEKKYPNHPGLQTLAFLKGEIYLTYFFDLDRALQTYLSLIQKNENNPNLQQLALLMAAKTYLMKGDIENSRKLLEKITQKNLKPDAFFTLAKIELYQGKYDSAQTYLNRVLQLEGISGSLANDVLQIEMLIPYARSSPEALKNFLTADFLNLQQKKSEALKKLEIAAGQDAPPEFKVQILIQAAKTASDLEKFPQALEFCNQILKNPDLYSFGDQALFVMGEIFEKNLKDYQRAYQMFDQLLQDFPQSLYAAQSRERLKNLRDKFPGQVP